MHTIVGTVASVPSDLLKTPSPLHATAINVINVVRAHLNNMEDDDDATDAIRINISRRSRRDEILIICLRFESLYTSTNV